MCGPEQAADIGAVNWKEDQMIFEILVDAPPGPAGDDIARAHDAAAAVFAAGGTVEAAAAAARAALTEGWYDTNGAWCSIHVIAD